MDEISILKEKNKQMLEVLRSLRTWSWTHSAGARDTEWYEADMIIAKADLDNALNQA